MYARTFKLAFALLAIGLSASTAEAQRGFHRGSGGFHSGGGFRSAGGFHSTGGFHPGAGFHVAPSHSAVHVRPAVPHTVIPRTAGVRSTFPARPAAVAGGLPPGAIANASLRSISGFAPAQSYAAGVANQLAFNSSFFNPFLHGHWHNPWLYGLYGYPYV